jgi:hypothetical protein
MCPVCGIRKARRACPALGQEICAVCCGTKRLVEIACPSTCVYLATSREHPPAVAVRQRQHDIAVLYRALRDFSERQSQLFLLVMTFLRQYEPPDLQRIVDEDVGEATSALAATFETSAKGVIYEHRPASLPAERLATALRATLEKAAGTAGTAFERDAAVVLRRAAETAREIAAGGPREFLDWVQRILRESGTRDDQTKDEPEPSRLIVP